MDADYEDLCGIFGDKHTKNDRCDVIAHDVFLAAEADDSVSVRSTLEQDPALKTLPVLPTMEFMSTTDNRRYAIEKWKVKRGKQKGLVKVCKARSEVALSRPRVKGKFVKKAQFVSVTDLQGY